MPVLEMELIDPQPVAGASSGVAMPPGQREFSGRMLVFGLLFLGISMTVLMYVYWEKHTRPFRSLRERIGREFHHSRPNVEGGRAKGKGPWTLRVSMSVDFPPAESTFRADQIADRVLEIAKGYIEGTEFEQIEVNLIQFIPQEVAKTKTFTFPVTAIKSKDATPRD